MGEIRVQDEQGNVHVFPDGSTPEMIAQAMNVKPPEQSPAWADTKNFNNTIGVANSAKSLNEFRPTQAPVDLKQPSTVPNARIRNLPDPSDPTASGLSNLASGAGTGAMLSAIPAAPAMAEAASPALPFLGRAVKAALPAAKAGAKVGVSYAATSAAIEGAKKLIPQVQNIPGIEYLPFLVSSMMGHQGEPEPTPGKSPVPPVRGGIAHPEAEPPPRYASPPIRGGISYPESEPEPMQQRPQGPPPVVPKETENTLKTLLKSATGATPPPPPVRPGVPIGQQRMSPSDAAFSKNYPNETMKSPSPDVERQWQKSAGFDSGPELDVAKPNPERRAIPRSGAMTPVQSSAVKAYKYDPAAQEMHVQSQDGTTYVHGEVSPDQAQAFEAAPSKGKAWQAIRDSSPLVRKVGPGKTGVNVKPPMKFRSADPNEPAPNDLTDILTRSLKQAKNQ